jgi:hypothetical protein
MSKFRGWRLFAAGSIVVLLFLSATWTPAASASPLVPGTTTSSTYAGYQVDSAPANEWAAASFAVPKVSCTSKRSGVFIGVVIYTSSTFFSNGIEAGCTNGTAWYYTATYLNGLFSGEAPVGVGDHIFTKMKVSSGSTTFNLIVDNGGPGSVSGRSYSDSSPTSALIGMTAVDSSGVQLPLPHFATMTFGPANFDQMLPSAAGAVAVNMETGGGVLQIKTSALKPSGKFWTESFKHS